MISTSILSVKDNLGDNLKKLDLTSTDFMHVDVMDGIFVENTSVAFDVYQELLEESNTPLDVHLMVK